VVAVAAAAVDANGVRPRVSLRVVDRQGARSGAVGLREGPQGRARRAADRGGLEPVGEREGARRTAVGVAGKGWAPASVAASSAAGLLVPSSVSPRGAAEEAASEAPRSPIETDLLPLQVIALEASGKTNEIRRAGARGLDRVDPATHPGARRAAASEVDVGIRTMGRGAIGARERLKERARRTGTDQEARVAGDHAIEGSWGERPGHEDRARSAMGLRHRDLLGRAR
jgi:hypothetical protein